MNKKANTPVAIVIFVIALVAVIGVAWYSITLQNKDIKIILQGPELIERTYTQVPRANILIGDVVAKAATKTTSPNKAEFIQNVMNELQKYKVGNEYPIEQLSQFESQLTEQNIGFEENIVSVNLELTAKESIEESGFEFLSVTHKYTKEFSAPLGAPPAP